MPTQRAARPSVFNNNEHAIVTQEIEKLLLKGVIQESQHESGEFISTIFLRPKPDGSHRSILNLKGLNCFVQYHHFKMDTLESAVRLMKHGCFMASIDLKDAYYTIPMAPEHQKFLKFWFNGKLYKFTCLPMGLSSAPRIFTKVLKPVYAHLHSLGHVTLGYIDDSYLQGDTFEECCNNVKATVSLFHRLGFHLHPTKSVITPTQKMTFLGFYLDSMNMRVSPTDAKITKTTESCLRLKRQTRPSITEVAEVIGTLVSNFPGTQFGPLHYRSLEKDKTNSLAKERGNYSAHMTLSHQSVMELDWWISNISCAYRDITHPNPSVTLHTDASQKGWGAVCGNKKTGGRWMQSESVYHINVLELLAAFIGLKSLCREVQDSHVQLLMDNTTAVAYVNHMGGSTSSHMNDLARELWDWCITRNIWVSAAHIAGELNVEADRKSRHFSDKHEWMLNRKAFQDIVSVYPELDIDLFASRLNNQLNSYCSWKADPHCSFVDAFSIDWSKFHFYAFPPFSLIPRCIQKITQDKAKGILIIPLWPTQTWFPLVLQLLYDQPWILRPSLDLLHHPNHKELHPLNKKLHLMVCPLSGTPLDNTRFLQKSHKSSWPHGDQAPKNNTRHTWKSGWSFVVKGTSISIHPI